MNREQIQNRLEVDPAWSAYALADLDSHYQQSCSWSLSGEGVVLQYTGLQPPVLFAIGPPQDVDQLFLQLSPGKFQFTLLEPHRDLLRSRLQVEKELRMWRMKFAGDSMGADLPDSVRRLQPGDQPAIEALIAGHSDSPDAYHPSQLAEPGVFYGSFENDELVAMAGTHVVSSETSVAAVGNIFTHPALRGRGLGTQVTRAVTAYLVRQGLKLIVLNVSLTNAPAIHCYQKVGYQTHCQYLEGMGTLLPVGGDILSGKSQPSYGG